MGLLGSLFSATIKVASLPVAAVADVVGELSGNTEPSATVTIIKSALEDLDDAL